MTIQDQGNQVDRAPAEASVVLFVCANCVRSDGEGDPLVALYDRERAFAPRVTAVACTGKLQPEHLLKAFEVGADVVCVVACERDDCHRLEGSRRAAQRVEYVRGLLEESGVGGGRLLMFHLPGTAHDDTAGQDPAAASSRSASRRAEVAVRLGAIRDEIISALETLGATPLRARPAEQCAPNMETA